MRLVTVTKNEAGQRLDKLMFKYMNLASKSFIYKMIRKKNITLNGKKCDGSEKLAEGDEIRLFLAEETIEKFSEVKIQKVKKTALDQDNDMTAVIVFISNGGIYLCNPFFGFGPSVTGIYHRCNVWMLFIRELGIYQVENPVKEPAGNIDGRALSLE